MEQVSLSAQKRTVLGRKVKSLRREGMIPAHVFGHKVKTIHVQVKAGEFDKVFEKAGETGIIDLAVDGEKRPVLVKNVQTHPVSDIPLHIDFYQVNLSEKVKVNVPLEIVGEAPAVHKKIGLLLTPVTEIEIEALPADLPEKIEVDVAHFENVGDEIKVKDLKIDRSKIEIHADEELVVVQIGELVTREMEEVEAEIEAEQAEAVEEVAEAEGAVPPEGEEAKEAEAKEGAEATEKSESEKKEETKAEEPQEEKKK
ncbi:MAG: 50S ribosomal protein L25 [Candidatus Curtissbacteria bacterium GW2011_GWA1_40_16]|uniref:Large ribosomal subunit protein bL25 n=1 Tax=Candidatus Curtissbacteria bacterium GW2011_GWA1_40_16 TaxID=1618405 RepID=A0A0G0TQP6_9BACT|nr:MAG: 50S ribosomal protein L25 [Candidatus Curtissbacteria bacterium GW2011_GWA1_40_16]